MIREIILALPVALALSMPVYAADPAPQAPPSQMQLQINEVQQRIERYRQNLSVSQASVGALQGLISNDERQLAALKAAEHPTGGVPPALKKAVPMSVPAK